jgi:hypothetical protein
MLLCIHNKVEEPMPRIFNSEMPPPHHPLSQFLLGPMAFSEFDRFCNGFRMESIHELQMLKKRRP